MARVGELAPELVVVSGDVFDHPRVTASPIATFTKAVGDLMDRLPGVAVAIAAGLRDTPLDAGRLGPLEVVGAVGGVEVATETVRRFRVGETGGSVTLLPYAALVRAKRGRPVAEPDAHAEWNVLVAYADADFGRGRAWGAVAPGRWDYVALGSRHVRTQVAEGVHYCGSLERIGSDPWEEAATDKGFLLADLDSGSTTFCAVGARAVVSLAAVDAGAGGPVAVARRLSEALAGVPGGVEGKLIRVPVRGLAPNDLAAFDRDALEPLRKRVAGLRVDALPVRDRERLSAGGRGGAGTKARRGGRLGSRSATSRVAEPEAGKGGGKSGSRPPAARTLADLQASGLGGPSLDLRGASGLIGLVGGVAALWDETLAALHEAFAPPASEAAPSAMHVASPAAETFAPSAKKRPRRGAPVARGRVGAVVLDKDGFEPLLGAALADRGLRREEYAAVWFGAGSVGTWLSAGVSLLRGSASAGEAGARPRLPEARQGGWPAPRSLADWLRRLVKETERDVSRLRRSEAETLRLKARLATLREDAAEIQGDIEAGVMGWVRERQDAETRLLLHRDRARELKDRLKEAEKAGGEAGCSACGREVGDRMPDVVRARREEWDGVVQDGRWWRKRRDQLEDKPAEMKAAETRALEIEAAMDEASEELERRRVQAQELEHVRRRLRDLREAESHIAPPGAPSRPEANVAAQASERLRERIHVEAVTLTGGRLAKTFPGLFEAWTLGRRRSGGDVAALELAARIVLAELAVAVGLPLGSVLLPRGLDALHLEDVPRALVQLAKLARRLPLVFAGTSGRVVAAAPECFDYLFVSGHGPSGEDRIMRRRPRPSPLRLAAH